MALSAGAKVPPLNHLGHARVEENSAPTSLRSFSLRKQQNPVWSPNCGIISIACSRKGVCRGGGPFDVCRFLGSSYPSPFSPSSSPAFPASSSSSSSSCSTVATPAAAFSCNGRRRRAGGVAAPAPAAAADALLQRREFLLGSSRIHVELRRACRPLLHGHNQSARGQFGCRVTLSARDGAVLDDVPHLSQWVKDVPRFANPLQDNPAYKAVSQYFVEDDDIVAKNVVVKRSKPSADVYFRRAGPRETVCFKGEDVRAAIVTCGGLCPGLNTVIREIVCGLWTSYGVRDIIGIEGGYAGFYSSNTIALNPKVVNDIHKRGGTILGTSRGGHDKTKIVAAIVDRGINQVYIIGGDGTQKGANVIYEELKKLGLKVVVAGIPKTIDNDIAVIDKSFGFDTAVEEAQRAINSAHVEAESVKNGVGLVKLMGRYSGYIALYATLASRDVDCCLIPEVPFYLEGSGGLFEFVRKRLRDSGHMVIVVAEGAGQELISEERSHTSSSDASGNQALQDVGLWLCHQLRGHFSGKESLTLKYIDPTYMVRAIPSNASDNVYCTLLAHSAMHGAMAGYTGFTVGPVNGRHAYIPICTAVETQNKVSITDRMWARLLSSTNQPDFLQYDHAIEVKRAAKALSLKNRIPDNVAPTNGAVPQEIKGSGLKSEPSTATDKPK